MPAIVEPPPFASGLPVDRWIEMIDDDDDDDDDDIDGDDDNDDDACQCSAVQWIGGSTSSR